MPPATLGSAIPALTAHAISVSLPTWRDNVGYEEGEKRVIDAMVTGYPRFVLHRSVKKLAGICERKFGAPNERCLLLPSKKVADHCRSFMQERSSQSGTPVDVRLIHFLICPEDKQNRSSPADVDSRGGGNHTRSPSSPSSAAAVDLHIVLFPADDFPLARQFWQHSGLGISSRLAEHCLAMLPDDSRPSSPTYYSRPGSSKPMHRHYSAKSLSLSLSWSSSQPIDHLAGIETLKDDENVYLEERYGRNLSLSFAHSAKKALQRRIAGVLVHDSPDHCVAEPLAGSQEVEIGPSSRGVTSVSEDDVFLYPTGMAAIWSAHMLISSIRPPTKSVCFGFPYTDTLKVLQKWGPGCHFFGHGLDADIDELELMLEKEDSSSPPIQGLFTEFPSNPLLRSANLPRLRALADKYDFLIVIDETIGNFVNVEVLPYADIVVSSLSKVFSGDANVLGGSLVLNPTGRHYDALKSHMSSSFEDIYFDEDAIYMERNSRDFERRIGVIDANTEAVCDFLRSRSVVGGGGADSVIKEVIYPKWTTRENYEHCRTKGTSESGRKREGGFGGLFSLTFTSSAASQRFFDALPCYKGPSLGTNFTLACPYTVLGHYNELEWAGQYGVEEGLVRVSVGLEEREGVLKEFETTLMVAEGVM